MEHIEYEGWKDCVRLSNGTAELVVTTAFGPRIIHYGRPGGPNAFQVIPKTRGTIQEGNWSPYGGHRLWHAPEVMPRTYQADNAPVEATETGPNAVSVRNKEPDSGLTRETRVSLAPQGTAVKVEHRLTNDSHWAVTLAPWGLSIVANGGRVVIPQEPFVSHDDDLTPARPVVLWKFTDMADPRWRWGRKYLTLRQGAEEGNPQKVGVWNAQGWAAHLTPQQAFIIAVDVAPGGPATMPDQGCNYETYTDGPFQELETLGPLQLLEPGGVATHTERWFLASLASEMADNDEALDVGLLPLVAQARNAFAVLP